MIRLIAKYLMRRSLDYDLALPAWVQRRLNVDPQLALYWHNLHSLEKRLRTSAPAWLEKQIDTTMGSAPDRSPTFVARNVQVIGKRSFRKAQIAMALCAAVLVAITAALWNSDYFQSKGISPDKSIAHVTDSSKKPRSPDQRSLDIAKANAKKLIQQAQSVDWKERLELLRGERIPPSMQEIYFDQTGLDQLANQSVGQLRQCVEVAGRSTGQLMKSVESGVLQQRNQISSSFRNSMDSASKYWLSWTARIGDSMGQTP